MSTGEPSTIHVVSADGVAAEATALDSGVPGLVIVGVPDTDRWRLVHTASGRVVSRSAQHADPDVLRKLAHRLAAFTDWTHRDIRMPGPVLRREIEEAARDLGLHPDDHLDPATSTYRPVPAVAPTAPSVPSTATDPAAFPSAPEQTGEVPSVAVDAPDGRADQVEQLQARLRSTERERALLRRILRRVHTSVPPGTFADAIRDLDAEERALLGTLITDGASDSTGVVRSMPTASNDAPSASPSSPPRPSPETAPDTGTDTGAAAG